MLPRRAHPPCWWRRLGPGTAIAIRGHLPGVRQTILLARGVFLQRCQRTPRRAGLSPRALVNSSRERTLRHRHGTEHGIARGPRPAPAVQVQASTSGHRCLEASLGRFRGHGCSCLEILVRWRSAPSPISSHHMQRLPSDQASHVYSHGPIASSAVRLWRRCAAVAEVGHLSDNPRETSILVLSHDECIRTADSSAAVTRLARLHHDARRGATYHSPSSPEVSLGHDQSSSSELGDTPDAWFESTGQVPRCGTPVSRVASVRSQCARHLPTGMSHRERGSAPELRAVDASMFTEAAVVQHTRAPKAERWLGRAAQRQDRRLATVEVLPGHFVKASLMPQGSNQRRRGCEEHI